MLELSSIKNLHTPNFLKLIEKLPFNISDKQVLSILEEALSPSEKRLLKMLANFPTSITPKYSVEFREGHALNMDHEWVKTLESISHLKQYIKNTPNRGFQLEKLETKNYYKLHKGNEYCALIRPINWTTIHSKDIEPYENLFKRINNSNTYEKVKKLVKELPAYNPTNHYNLDVTIGNTKDIKYNYRALTTIKSLCSTIKLALTAKSENVSRSHCFEMIAVITGHQSWNILRASNAYQEHANGSPSVVINTTTDDPEFLYFKDIFGAIAYSKTLMHPKKYTEIKILPKADSISMFQTPWFDAEYDYVTPFTKGSIYIATITPWEEYLIRG